METHAPCLDNSAAAKSCLVDGDTPCTDSYDNDTIAIAPSQGNIAVDLLIKPTMVGSPTTQVVAAGVLPSQGTRL